MANVLKVTDEKGIIHVTPLMHKAFYESRNSREKAEGKWIIEEIDEEDAKDLPVTNENFVKPGDALKRIAEKDDEIAELKKQLAIANGTAVDDDQDLTATGKSKKVKAAKA